MNKNKIILICGCLVLAAIFYIIFLKPQSSGISDYKGQIVYIKCNNPKCVHVQEMDKAEYFTMLHEKFNDEERPLCSKCGSSARRYTKCPKCSQLYFHAADKCPDCGYSELDSANK
ncbi:MAG: hypothetical protein A2Y10_17545 [Planctomycetes bacterium GWF2_41_51]|nr:MAG: hypothetical protein A2Y10_17545 [Planctomycetes bacterium GWF2_41_51]HBG28031.1 hypothetical protein [Phycisphaerales bacterium]